jgi:hypothetical protein
MAFTNLEKMVLIYGEARGNSDLARQIYRERFHQSNKSIPMREPL